MTTTRTKRTNKRKQKQNKMNDTISNEEEKHTRKGKKQKNNLFSGIYHARLDIKKFISYILHVFIRTFKTEEQEWHRKKHNKATKQYRNAKERKKLSLHKVVRWRWIKKKQIVQEKTKKTKSYIGSKEWKFNRKYFGAFLFLDTGVPFAIVRLVRLVRALISFILFHFQCDFFFVLFCVNGSEVFFVFFFIITSVHHGDVLTIVDVVGGEIDEINLYWFFSVFFAPKIANPTLVNKI